MPETTAKIRRGVASARGAQRLKFSHEHAKPNGLFIAHLDAVTVTKITIGENTSGLPSFTGMDVPRLVLTFASNEPEINARKYVNLTFNAVESNAYTIPNGKDSWKVDTVFSWMKHILDVYVLKGRELTEDEANKLSLDFEDYDENGEYVPVEAEKVLAGYKTLFENFVNMLNTAKDGKPAYLDKDGKSIPVWIKLIRYIKKKNNWQAVNNGDLSFPTFVGEGCIEIFKQDKPSPSIRIDVLKECILPKEDVNKTPQQPIANNQFPGIMAGGSVIPGAQEIMTETMGDSPF